MRPDPPRGAEPGRHRDRAGNQTPWPRLGEPRLPVRGLPCEIREPPARPQAPSQTLRSAGRQDLVLLIPSLLHVHVRDDRHAVVARHSDADRRGRAGGAQAQGPRHPVKAPSGVRGKVSPRGCRRGPPRRPVAGVPGVVHPNRSPGGAVERLGGDGQDAGLADGVADLARDHDPVRGSGEGIAHAGGRSRGVFRERAISAGPAVRSVPRLRPPDRAAVPGDGRRVRLCAGDRRLP